MKYITLILLLSGCAIDRLADRMETSSNQLWEVYTELRVIQVDNFAYHQRITAVPYGKPFPKYAYLWNEYFDSLKVGDMVALTDSLRFQVRYKNNYKQLR